MDLGKFSLSLAVKNLDASRAFYQAFGFRVIGGDGEHHVVMRNAGCTLGLFMGMFEENILTFHPGDVRAVQAGLKEAGIGFEREAADGEGPAHAVLRDPDGNVILLDQF